MAASFERGVSPETAWTLDLDPSGGLRWNGTDEGHAEAELVHGPPEAEGVQPLAGLGLQEGQQGGVTQRARHRPIGHRHRKPRAPSARASHREPRHV